MHVQLVFIIIFFVIVHPHALGFITIHTWKFNFHWKCSLSTLMIPGNHLSNRQDIANALICFPGTPPGEHLWDPYVGGALSTL